MSNLSRRNFVIGSSAIVTGLVIGIDYSNPDQAFAAMGSGTSSMDPLSNPEVGIWVTIKPNNEILFRVVRSEMGQGIVTGLAQLIAEELECDWSKVSYEYPSPLESLKRNHVWGTFHTGGSHSIRKSENALRTAGATAKFMLIQAAANRWNASISDCVALNSVITHLPTKRALSYGDVAEAASKLTPPRSVSLKSPKQWKVIGQPLNRIDGMRDKVTGRQIYAIDLDLPNMLVANIRQCPVFGGTVKSYDASVALKMSGVVKVVQVGDNAVAAVADTFWHAKKAMDAVAINWDYGVNVNVTSLSIQQDMQKGFTANNAIVANSHGDAKSALSKASKMIESTYLYPFLAHATLEPQTATAKWTPQLCEVWAPTQDGNATYSAAIKASGLSPDKCNVYKLNLGGGFGRRGAFQDFTTQAVTIARQIPGVPIKLIWTREEDMTHDFYHPQMMCKLSASFDKKNDLTAFHIRLSGQSILASMNPAPLDQNYVKDPMVFEGLDASGEASLNYSFRNLLIDYSMRNSCVPVGMLRGVNSKQNTLFLEAFMDELADSIGQDPLAFRKKYIHDKRALAVLDAVAKGIGWNQPAAVGVSRGLAQVKAFGSYVAAACELTVTNKTDVKINRIIAAIDPSYSVNPAQIERQISGSFVYGLSALFGEEITIKNGSVVQSNFDTFTSMKLSQMPKVETIIIQGGGSDWGGVGEPPIAVVAPAVVNAISRATGKRFYRFPLKNSGINLI